MLFRARKGLNMRLSLSISLALSLSLSLSRPCYHLSFEAINNATII